MSKKDTADLIVWDIAGQSSKFERFHSTFYANARGTLLVFDLTKPATFESLEKWRSDVVKVLGKEIPFVLIGNKKDLIIDMDRVMDPKIAEDYANEKNSIYIETSAKTGEQVDDAFLALSRRMAGLDVEDVSKPKKEKKNKKAKKEKKKHKKKKNK